MTELHLVLSAAYVDQELAAEFGRIPPAFLPIGVSRLYEAQVAWLKGQHSIFLTIPETFTPDPYDQRRLRELNVILVPVPEGLRLGESIVYAINYIGIFDGQLKLLHGDTLIEGDVPSVHDLIAVKDQVDDYSWAVAKLDSGNLVGLETVTTGTGPYHNYSAACGFFAFSNAASLVRGITRARGDFIGGLNVYAQERKLQAFWAAGWLDFGHLQTYFRSRKQIATSRSFNSLQIDDIAVRKQSDDQSKIKAEAKWFSDLPTSAKPYSARLLDTGSEDGIVFYKTEYQYAPTLSELFIFSAIGLPTWRKILRSCHDFLEICAGCKGVGSGDENLAELVVCKTNSRIERYARETSYDIDKPNRYNGHPLPSIRRITESLAQAIDLHSGRAEKSNAWRFLLFQHPL